MVYLHKYFSMAKVIHVHFIGRRKDYYFSSIAAIFDVLTEEEIGYKHSYLLHAGLGGNGTLINDKVIIKQAQLIAKTKKARL